VRPLLFIFATAFVFTHAPEASAYRTAKSRLAKHKHKLLVRKNPNEKVRPRSYLETRIENMAYSMRGTAAAAALYRNPTLPSAPRQPKKTRGDKSTPQTRLTPNPLLVSPGKHNSVKRRNQLSTLGNKLTVFFSKARGYAPPKDIATAMHIVNRVLRTERQLAEHINQTTSTQDALREMGNTPWPTGLKVTQGEKGKSVVFSSWSQTGTVESMFFLPNKGNGPPSFATGRKSLAQDFLEGFGLEAKPKTYDQKMNSDLSGAPRHANGMYNKWQ